MDWRDDEVTDAQINYISKMCKMLKCRFEMPENKGEASDIIDELRIKMSENKI